MRTIQEIQRQENCDYPSAMLVQEKERKAELPSSTGSGARMTRVQIENAIREASQDEPFTMPFFLASCLVAELLRQKLSKVVYTGDDFSVAVKIKKAVPSNDKAQ